ncbi:hypothetical protein Mal4_22720 [Maioricimonas rarisocia]|uniref:FHA domain-containing protein n=1 Tax=Maioricimonas rarisocia TaxID=2528026 RepID=A0A517Z650_9PLAN|nr:FHA domain-containing protein [Maioricimonas rarisocia]QDU37953.1 hypothetical protein Mal4_22720 [Maioricimonas rarisocia]
MRVRLFVVGTGNRSDVIHLEQFPSTLATAADGELTLDPGEPRQTLCDLDEVDGNLVLRDRDDKHRTLVNGLPMASGPLLPGDRLQLGSQQVIVSYERTTPLAPPEAVYHFAE